MCLIFILFAAEVCPRWVVVKLSLNRDTHVDLLSHSSLKNTMCFFFVTEKTCGMLLTMVTGFFLDLRRLRVKCLCVDEHRERYELYG